MYILCTLCKLLKFNPFNINNKHHCNIREDRMWVYCMCTCNTSYWDATVQTCPQYEHVRNAWHYTQPLTCERQPHIKANMLVLTPDRDRQRLLAQIPQLWVLNYYYKGCANYKNLAWGPPFENCVPVPHWYNTHYIASLSGYQILCNVANTHATIVHNNYSSNN